MDGVANEEEFDQYGDPKMEDDDDDDDDATYTTRRSRTTLPKSGRPFKRRSHDKGLNYSTATKKRQEDCQTLRNMRDVCNACDETIIIICISFV